MTLGANDYCFELSHYDFSATHPDFINVYGTTVYSPTYVPIPWLAKSDNPAEDTFSDWFRYKAGTNIQLDNPIVLEYHADGTHR